MLFYLCKLAMAQEMLGLHSRPVFILSTCTWNYLKTCWCNSSLHFCFPQRLFCPIGGELPNRGEEYELFCWRQWMQFLRMLHGSCKVCSKLFTSVETLASTVHRTVSLHAACFQSNSNISNSAPNAWPARCSAKRELYNCLHSLIPIRTKRPKDLTAASNNACSKLTD